LKEVILVKGAGFKPTAKVVCSLNRTEVPAIEVTENKVNVPDLNATIGYALGLPLDQVLFSASKRPFTVADKGQPLTGLFG
jgi:hypothetical protein